MFGYVIPNTKKLTEAQHLTYRSFYCGLCSTLGRRYGQASRLTVNYDMTFLVMMLTSVYEEDNLLSGERCIVHPFRKHCSRTNRFTDYAADMNIVLAHYNLLDDWEDERKPTALAAVKVLSGAVRRVEDLYPEKCRKIASCLEELSGLETAGELNPDIPAECFGRLMGAVFDYEGKFSEDLKAFGSALGKFIYVMDACNDLEADVKKENYNPMVSLRTDDFEPLLKMLMAACTEIYERLPVKVNMNIIENILFSGVWSKFRRRSDEQ